MRSARTGLQVTLADIERGGTLVQHIHSDTVLPGRRQMWVSVPGDHEEIKSLHHVLGQQSTAPAARGRPTAILNSRARSTTDCSASNRDGQRDFPASTTAGA